MQVRVLLFGAEAQAAGSATLDVRVDPGSTCLVVRDRMAELSPALRPLLRAARFAVNTEFVPLDHVIGEGDEIALIGMVSGG